MKQMFRLLFVSICLSLWAGRVPAADLSQLSDADRKQVNEWMAQRAEAMVEAHRVAQDVRQAWADPKYTSPAVEELRARYRELQQSLLRTQEAIQKKVEELPAVQAKVRQLEEMREKERTLQKKITEKTGE